jgi:Tfp pilus tip-associated adhesin PilY1
VLVSGEGTGGTSVFALDVTDSVSDTGTVAGPKPLWTFTDVDMVYSLTKPTVIRAKLQGAERWLAVFACGPGATPNAVHAVYAVDITTGQLVWTFDTLDAGSFITTDIASAETADPSEEGSPTLDGYTDRLYFGDSKGRVWKLDPAGNGSAVDAPAR